MKLRVPTKLELFDQQPEGVRHLMSDRNKLLLDDMGFGKTCQSIVAANSLGLKRILILCPPSVRFQWAREIEKWSVIPYKVQTTVGQMFQYKAHSRTAIVCPYNLLLSPNIFDQIKQVKWGALIADEIQNCKSSKAARTTAVLGKNGVWKNSIYKWGLSGTPMTTTPIDLWPIAKTIGRHHFDMSWMTFTREFCGRFRGKWGWDIKGATRLPKLRKMLFDTGLALRRERAQMPGDHLRFVYVGEDPQDWSSITDRIDLKKSSLGLTAGEISTMRREAGDEKSAHAIEYVKEKCTYGKVVIFTWHQAVTKQIAKGLEPYFWQVEKYYGGMSLKAKSKALNEFIHGDADVLVANIKSAGTALDGLQHVCSHCVFAEVPWNFTDIMQAFKRLVREGQTLPVLGDILLIGSSVEDYVVSGLARKEQINDQVFGQQC